MNKKEKIKDSEKKKPLTAKLEGGNGKKPRYLSSPEKSRKERVEKINEIN